MTGPGIKTVTDLVSDAVTYPDDNSVTVLRFCFDLASLFLMR